MEWQIENSKLQYKVDDVESKWKAKIKKTKAVKELVIKTKSFLAQIIEMEIQAKNKANLAKLNMIINDIDVRGAIQDMVNFTESL